MGWIGVDLDGTLAHYKGWTGSNIGEPIQIMKERVMNWLMQGKEVRIFTERVSHFGHTDDQIIEAVQDIEAWTQQHFGRRLKVTAEKDMQMEYLWDDRCIQVQRNTGKILGQEVIECSKKILVVLASGDTLKDGDEGAEEQYIQDLGTAMNELVKALKPFEQAGAHETIQV